MRIRRLIPTLLFACLSLWFWIFLSPGVLRMLETTQFLPYTWARLSEALGYPGGVAELLSEQFVQFFKFAVPAGILVTLFVCALQLLSWRMMVAVAGEKENMYPFSFIPAFAAWAFLCVFGNLFTAVVALVCSLALFLAYVRITRHRVLYLFVFALLQYYLLGPLSTVFVVAVLFRSVKRGDSLLLACSAGALALYGLIPIVLNVFLQYTLKELYLGIDYFNEPGKYTPSFYVLWGAVAVLPLIAVLNVAKISHKTLNLVVYCLLLVVVFGGGWLYMIKNCNPLYERVFEYDKLCCDRDWDAVLAKGREIPPFTLAEMAAINLALAKNGTLLDKMFTYRQPGPTALFPDYAAGYLITLIAAEAVYHSGMLNTARHYSFEAYESYPNYRISSRHMKRIAEIDMINGNDKIARRYLKALSHTLFYSKWARKFLVDSTAWRNVPEYSALASCRDHSDHLYSDSSDDDKREMLRRIVDKNPARSISSDYLLAYDLLAKDLYSLKKDLRRFSFDGDVPVHIQEAAVILVDVMGETDFAHNVGEQVRARYKDFEMALMVGTSGDSIVSNFGHTFWYYFSNTQQYVQK
jgi:hypothetical protein